MVSVQVGPDQGARMYVLAGLSLTSQQVFIDSRGFEGGE